MENIITQLGGDNAAITRMKDLFTEKLNELYSGLGITYENHADFGLPLQVNVLSFNHVAGQTLEGMITLSCDIAGAAPKRETTFQFSYDLTNG